MGVPRPSGTVLFFGTVCHPPSTLGSCPVRSAERTPRYERDNSDLPQVFSFIPFTAIQFKKQSLARKRQEVAIRRQTRFL